MKYGLREKNLGKLQNTKTIPYGVESSSLVFDTWYYFFFPFCFLLYFIVVINVFLDIYVCQLVLSSIKILEINKPKVVNGYMNI